MLKEALSFVEKFEADSTRQPIREGWRGEKFFVIKTKKGGEKLVYNGFDVLDDDSSVKVWVDINEHYREVLGNLKHYILPATINKAMGSTGGLGTYCFFMFRLSKKNLNGLKEKINKTQFSDGKDTEVGTNNVQEVLRDSIPDLTEKIGDNFKYLDYCCLILTDGAKFGAWKTAVDNFIKERMSSGRKIQKSLEGDCFACSTKSLSQ